ncbi:hypothetical protein J2W55_000680 [Mucilaginibacter pocheonensis]|uniref:Uncharacterized protein n=1 Tax=Mucilaginibacter pocheonensis TaxID=398050 RepID=A0ABU1T656_9SPHI|nr:hypothetical protein [Mucilaginibacter pocheonensis]
MNVLVRAQYVLVFSRLGIYDHATLDALIAERPRRYFEYWGHEASILPVDCHPLLRWRMADASQGKGIWRQLEIYAGEKRKEADALLERIRQEGNFDVKETIWSSPTSKPVYNTKLIARRQMIGSVLQEFMYAAPGTANSPVERIEYISFNRIEGRWRSVSMDIRVPVGLMPAASFDRGQESKIRLIFDPFPIAGKGSSVTGQMLRMDETINFEDPDHVVKEQHFILADGSGKSWLAHRYEYTKRK